jgi:hypothetical protein
MITNVGNLTLPADGANAIAAYLRVYMSSGVIAVAGITDNDFMGTLAKRYVPTGLGGSGVAEVVPRGRAPHLCVAAEAFAIYSTLYTAANGKVADTAASTSIPYGIALQAAAADGDIVEVLPFGGYPAQNS